MNTEGSRKNKRKTPIGSFTKGLKRRKHHKNEYRGVLKNKCPSIGKQTLDLEQSIQLSYIRVTPTLREPKNSGKQWLLNCQYYAATMLCDLNWKSELRNITQSSFVKNKLKEKT